MNKKLKITLFVVLFICLGFLRESLFVSINGVLYNKFFGTQKHIGGIGSSFFDLFSYQTLYYGKWCVTPVFVLLFWFIQKTLLWLLFSEKKTGQWLTVLYLSLFLLAGISFCIGWLTGNLNAGYRFSRIFIGLLESPVPSMILIPLTYFYKNFNSKI